MFVPKNHEITMRCPVCFGRDVDVLMKHDHWNPGHYACLKCSFQGSEAEVRSAYLDIQKKFKLLETRITVEDYDAL